MIRTLSAIAAAALGGSTIVERPGSTWLLGLALIVAVLVLILVIWKAEASIRAYRDARRDAQRRNRWAR